MYLIKKRLKDFSAAHRLIKGYQGKCVNLHGHNYVTTVLIAGEKLDEMDFLIDFSDIKALCDDWLMNHVDHVVLICSEDVELLEFAQQKQQKYYVLPDGRNTTAEAIAEHLFNEFEKLLRVFSEQHHTILTLMEVEVAETATSRAIYRRK